MRLVCLLFCLWFVISSTSVDATVVVPAEFAEMVDGSQVIVHGVVRSVVSQIVGPRRTIESVVTVTVIDAMKGPSGSIAVFRVPGGQVGRYRRVMVGAPQFAEGDEVVVFLAGRPPAMPMPFGLNQGVYRVTRAAGRAMVTPLIVEGTARDPRGAVRGDPARRPLVIDAFAAAVRAATERQR